jgi:hypothetical protein
LPLGGLSLGTHDNSKPVHILRRLRFVLVVEGAGTKLGVSLLSMMMLGHHSQSA